MLLYPHHLDLEGQGTLARHRLNVAGADERLTIASIDVAADRLSTIASLKDLILGEVGPWQGFVRDTHTSAALA